MKKLKILRMTTLLVLNLTSAWMMAGHLFAGSPQDSGLLNQEERREQQRQELLLQYTDPNGQFRPDLWRAGIEHFQQMSIADTIPLAPQKGEPAAIVARHLQWIQIGPAPLRIDDNTYQGDGPDSGQVVDIAIDPRGSADQVIYIAANDGGIWKSTDGGATWAPKTDFMPSLSMGAVALDPVTPSIVYAGTGNDYNNGFFKGIGVYRSTDGGDTWTIPPGSSVLNGRAIHMMVLPAANLLLVGTDSGLYKSVDGGNNYGNNSPNFDNGLAIISGSIDDLDLDTVTAGTVYASVGGVGLRRSTDSGTTFGASLFDANIPASFGYVSFAQSRTPDNQTLYVSIDTFGSPHTGKIFKSINSGASWFELANGSAKANGCQCGYDQTIGVDPLDVNRVYIAWQQLFGSTDGGTNFALISADAFGDHIHWDHHAMVFSPHLPGAAPTRVYFGTDGGISYTANGGGSYVNINEGIATCLFRGIDIGRGSAGNRGHTYGGCQDTGTIERRPAFAGNDWHLAIDGDGGPVVVDHANPLRTYGSDNQYFIFTANGGNSWTFPTAAASGLPDAGDGFASAFPVGMDPNNNVNVYAKNGTNLFLSTDTGSTFTSIHGFPSSIRELATTRSDSSIVWVSLNNRTLQLTSNALAGAGSTWSSITVGGAPLGVGIGGIAIDPINPAEAVVVYEGVTGINPANRTKHAFRTTDAGANWTDISGTDGGDPTQNLPDSPLHSVIIDPSTSPHTIIVSSDAGVMRTIDLGASWQILGIGLPTVDCTSLAIDDSVTPPLIRVGTYGRSVFQLAPLDNVPIISIPSDVYFADTCVGASNAATLYVCNTGDADLEVSAITSTNSRFSVVTPSSGYPVTISPDFCFPFRVQFAPSVVGNQQTTFIISDNDPASPTTSVRGFGKGIQAALTAFIANSGNFGEVCVGSFRDLNLTLNNSGGCPLVVSSISSSSGQFLVPAGVTLPIVVQPGDSVAVPIRFQPTSVGAKPGMITVLSNDPNTPAKSVSVSGNAPAAVIATAIANSGNFGNVCIGTFKDLDLTINNSGGCDLLVNNISSSSGQFIVPGVITYPLVIHAGAALRVPVRFQPTLPFGAKTGDITVASNDPTTPNQVVHVSGNAPPGSIRVTGSTDFGDVCAGRITEKTIAICNVGPCDLHVSSVSFAPACPDFTLINNAFPATVSPDSCLNVVIRMTPTSCGAKSCTLVIVTDDPVNPTITLVVTANNPCPEIDVSPDLAFEPEVIQSVGSCSSPLPFPISNKGQCNLTITSIVIGGVNAGDYALSGLPSFPIILEPGHIAGEGNLNVLFKPTEVARERRATITVTYISDPVTGATLSVTRQLCGEGVRTGARVLVMHGGVPVAMVEKIQLQRINANRNKGDLDTQDVSRNLPLVTVVPAAPCQPFQYHREYGTVSNPIQLLPGSYQVTVSAIVNGKRKSMSVGFDVSTCDFNPNVVVRF